MNQIAIIACAGWKGAGRGTEFVHLPAPFLPLEDGSTCASYLSERFREMDYDVVLTAGPLGYPFKACQPRHEFRTASRYAGMSGAEIARIIGVDPEGTPWTDELHRYIRTLGTLIVQPSPGWMSKHDSYCVALDAIARDYDRVVLVRGDKLYDARFLSQVMDTMPWPCQFSLEVYHSIFMLDRNGVAIYRRDAQAHRERSRAKQNWGQEMAKQPDGGEGTGRLDRAGIPHYGFHTPPWNEWDRSEVWEDMDHPPGYAKAKNKIAEGWYA